jgi:hypothetical protein
MEAKFDPALPLGGEKLSYWDKVELNRKYQCKHTDSKGKTHAASKYCKYSPLLIVNCLLDVLAKEIKRIFSRLDKEIPKKDCPTKELTKVEENY